MKLWVLVNLSVKAINFLREKFELIINANNEMLFQFLQDPNSFVAKINQLAITGIILPTHNQILDLFSNISYSNTPLKFIAFLGIVDERWNWSIFDSFSIPVIYPEEIYAFPQVEYIIGSIINIYRNIHTLNYELKFNKFDNHDFLNNFPIESLKNKVFGFLGWNKTCAILAEILNVSFSCKILVWANDNKILNFPQYVERIKQKESIFSRSDIVSIHLNPMEHDIISKKVLEKIKQNGIIINITSSLLLNEEDLIDLLEKNRIRGAILDLFDPSSSIGYSQKLFRYENTLVTPRIAAYSAMEESSMVIANSIIQWIQSSSFEREI